MSHVDEGTLHAYLDGALDALPAAEAARVREHLSSCDACAARLEEERALRDEASAILAGAAPGVIEMPPFEELRARARTGSGASAAGRRMARLAWAASVVLAVGAGWMLRAAAGPDVARQDSLTEAARTVASPAPSAEAPQGSAPVPTEAVSGLASSDADRRLADDAAETGERAVAAAVARTGRIATAPVEPTAPEPSPVADEVTEGVVRLDTLTFPRTAAEAKEAVAAVAGREEEVAGKTKVAANPIIAQPAMPAAQELRRSLEEPPSTVVQAAQRADLPVLSAGVRSTALSVPGLEVLSVTGMEGEGLAGAVRVRQLLADGDTLEIVSLPSGSDPAALAPVQGDGRTELVLPRDGGWLVVRAHASREALLELVRRMQAGS